MQTEKVFMESKVDFFFFFFLQHKPHQLSSVLHWKMTTKHAYNKNNVASEEVTLIKLNWL